jgi:tape measure domain-containing protein
MASEIYIKYSVDTADLQKATSIWDKLSAEEQQALSQLKEFNLTLKATGDGAEAAGRKLRGLGAGDSIARMRDQVSRLRSEMELLSPKSQEFADKLKELKGAEGNLAGMNKQMAGAQGGMGGLLGMAGRLIPALGAAFAIDKIKDFAKEAINVSMQFDAMRRGLEAASGGTLEAGRAMDFVSDISNRLGLNLIETANGYQSFAAAGRSAGLELNAQERIFSSVSEAGMRMGLTNEQLSGTFMALTQMLSKGTVQAEELRGQLSERIPGSFGIMARAVGVTERELGKMLEKGEVIAKDVLPKFAEELNKTFGGGNAELITSTAAATSRLDSEWAKFLDSVGQRLQPAYQKGLEATAAFISGVRKILSDEKVDVGNEFNVVKQVQRDFKILQSSNDKIKAEVQRYKSEGMTNLAKAYTADIVDNTQMLQSLNTKYFNDFKARTGKTFDEYQQNLKNLGQDLDPNKFNQNLVYTNLGFTDEYKRTFNQLKETRRLMVVEAQQLGAEFTKPVVDPKEAKKAAKAAKDAAAAMARDYANALADITSREKIAQSERKAVTQEGVMETMMQQEDLLKITMKFNKEREAAAAQYGTVPAAKRDAAELVATQKELGSELERLEISRRDKMMELTQQDIDSRLKAISQVNTRQNELVVTLTNKEEEQNLLRAQNDVKYAQQKLDLLNMLRENEVNITQQTLQEVNDEVAKAQAGLSQQTIKYYDTIFQKTDEIIQEQGSQQANLLQSADNVRFKSAARINKELVENQIATNEKRIANADDAAEKGSEAAKKAANAIRAENVKLKGDLIKIDQEIAENRQKTILAAVDLAAQITSQSFNLYQQQLSNELSAANKRYDAEVEMADGNKQKLAEIEERRRAKEAEIRKKQFRAGQYAAVADVVFRTAPIIAQYIAGVVTAPLAAIGIAAAAAQIGFIMAQPVPEFAEGTKGKKFRGGKAIVGERGTEKVVTESGKVYYTPPTATLIDLPKGSQVIPNHLLNQQEIAYATMGRSIVQPKQSGLEEKLSEIGGILKGLPIHQINMDERGFQKYIRTPNRTAKILNNRFGNPN